MKVLCPNACISKEFYTTAHISQYWKVDEFGNFIQVIEDCLDVIQKPTTDNIWICCECGAEAVIIDR